MSISNWITSILAMPAPTAKCSDEETQALGSILSDRNDVKMEKKDVLDPMTLSCDQMEPTGSNMNIPGAAPHNTYTGKGRLIANWQVHRPQRPPRSDRITKDYNRVRARANPYVSTSRDVARERRTGVHSGCEKCRRYAYSRATESNAGEYDSIVSQCPHVPLGNRSDEDSSEESADMGM